MHSPMLPSARSCSMEGCRSPSRTVCICCEKSFCLEHLTQHFVRINGQVPPLSDKINGLSKRLTKFLSFEPSYIVALEKWREEAHRTVEEYYETKRRDLVDDRRDKLKKEIERVRHTMDKLLRHHNAVKEDVEILQQDIRLIEQKFNELQSLHFTIKPLVIDENLIVRDLLPLPTPCRTMKIPFDEFSAMAENDKQLLIHQPPNLSLFDRHFTIIKQVPWPHDEIWDICWSSTISRFIVITNTEVYNVDHNTMTFTRCPISDQVEWYRATCSESSLFLLTQGMGPSIFECKLPPSNKGMKQRQPPETCAESEYIFDIKTNHRSLAMVIYNTEKGTTRLDLCSAANLQRLWTVDVGQGFRCCLLHGEQWMVADALSRRLFYIASNGKLLKVDRYAYQPWNIIQWGKYIIGVRTAEGINLH